MDAIVTAAAARAHALDAAFHIKLTRSLIEEARRRRKSGGSDAAASREAIRAACEAGYHVALDEWEAGSPVSQCLRAAANQIRLLA